MPRRQCAKCPWKVGTNPNEIPNGYCRDKHAALSSTIAEPSSINLGGTLRLMACHESPVGRELPCVGWLANQLGPGNNIALRLAVCTKQVSADFEIDGPQHATLEDTLPTDTKLNKALCVVDRLVLARGGGRLPHSR